MHALNLLIKPASGNCNMRCKYCFYFDEMSNREVQSYGIMSKETIEIILTKALKETTHHLTIAFQGGEPTLAGFSFFQHVIKVVKEQNVNNCEVSYGLQTNGYSIDEKWVNFFVENKFLIGVSVDGTKEIHDKYRHNVCGGGTYDDIMHTIDLFKEYKVDFNVLTVVHAEIADKIGSIYNYYKRKGFMYQQYIECLEPLGEERGGQVYSLTPEKYSKFLITLFRKWYKDLQNGHYVYNRFFENILMIMSGQRPESCNMQGICGKQWVVEADGSVYPCDFYALDEWKLGNLITDSFLEIEKKRLELQFIEVSKDIPKECQACRWFSICRNGCRRLCEPTSTAGRSKNYYCKAFKEFYNNTYQDFVDIKRNMIDNRR